MKSRYFRLSLTNKCNLSCYFCHNEGQENYMDYSMLTADDIIWSCQQAYKYGFKKFKLTGGEPTLRKDIFKIVEGLTGSGISELSMITNGSTLYTLANKFKESGLPRLNVSLYSINEAKFISNNGGSVKLLNNIIKGIDKAIQCGFSDMKINYVFHGKKEILDLFEIIDFCKERDLTLVVLPLLPYNLKPKDEQIKLKETYNILNEYGITNEEVIVDNEGIKKRLILLNNGAKVLLRVDELNTFEPYTECKSCAKHSMCREGIYPIRLSSNGVLRPCLAGGREDIDAMELIKSRDTNKFLNVLKSF